MRACARYMMFGVCVRFCGRVEECDKNGEVQSVKCERQIWLTSKSYPALL